MTFQYALFNCSWLLPFHCPELGHPVTTNAPPDITIRMGKVPENLPSYKRAGPLIQVAPQQTLFRFPNVASFLVSNGNEIVIEPVTEIDHEVRLLLLGSVTAMLLMQRGLLPLHGSGIATPKGAVLFVGHSGFGKSTLMSAFLNHGYAMLTDDIAAIEIEDGQANVLPGFPNMKLWQDSLEQLGSGDHNYQYVRGEAMQKYSVPYAKEINPSKLPLNAIYVLNPSNTDGVALTPLDQKQKLNALLNHTFQKMTLRRQGRHAVHFRQVSAVVRQTQIASISRGKAEFQLDKMMDLLEADFLA